MTLQLAHSQVGCLVPAATDEAQGRKAAVLHPSSCLPAQICWQNTDVQHCVSVLRLAWAGHGAAEGCSPDCLQQQVLIDKTVACAIVCVSCSSRSQDLHVRQHWHTECGLPQAQGSL